MDEATNTPLTPSARSTFTISQYVEPPTVEAMLGLTMTSVVAKDDEMIFTADDGSVFKLYYEPDCCASCEIEDICGDLDDLVGSPLLMSDESTSDENPEGVVKEGQDSFTWTFYRFATLKGYVNVRWYGSSNGYYSESVSFLQVEKARPLAGTEQVRDEEEI